MSNAAKKIDPNANSEEAALTPEQEAEQRKLRLVQEESEAQLLKKKKSELYDTFDQIQDEKEFFERIVKYDGDLNLKIRELLQDIASHHLGPDTHDLLFLDIQEDGPPIDSVFGARIQRALFRKNGSQRPTLLMLNSSGGDIKAAYRMANWLNQLDNSQLVKIVVPESAKSAATLLAISGDELHLGLDSELGPVDPQCVQTNSGRSIPALSLFEVLKRTASIEIKGDLNAVAIAKFLGENIDPTVLGEWMRATRASSQYCFNVLKRRLPQEMASNLANWFVYHYETHDFVIDHEEVASMLPDIVKLHTPEYFYSKECHDFTNTIRRIVGRRSQNGLVDYEVHVSGDLEDPIYFYRSKD